MDQQQRRVIPPPPALPAGSSSTSSSPLLGINDDFYELLQQQSSVTTRATTTSTTRLQFSDPITLKMEPELVGDFMGSSYAWGATQFGTIPSQLYNDANTLTSLTNYTTEAPPVVDIAAQFATYASPVVTTPVASATSTGAQIQALRDFMVYGNLGGAATPAAAMSSRVNTPVAGAFYNVDDGVAMGVGDGGGVIPSLAYRALCNEIYATTERSPHRSQFQRENHILAERQRREEMNEKFSALRAMIPKATKKDKASIVGDTIDYVLELEKRLKQLQACKDSSASGGASKVVGSCLMKKRKTSSRCEDAAMVVESPKGGNGGASTSSETTTTLLPVLLVGDCSAASSPSDQITAESKLQQSGGKTAKDAAAAASAEVEVQQLGKQAVLKVVCSRQRGHVLRVLNALEECKVEVLQSNVMTVADHSIHFVTVQLEEGVSVATEELVSAVLRAINPAEA